MSTKRENNNLSLASRTEVSLDAFKVIVMMLGRSLKGTKILEAHFSILSTYTESLRSFICEPSNNLLFRCLTPVLGILPDVLMFEDTGPADAQLALKTTFV